MVEKLGRQLLNQVIKVNIIRNGTNHNPMLPDRMHWKDKYIILL